MGTYAEDVRMVLAEVAPELAWRVHEPELLPPDQREWARYATEGSWAREEYEILWRANRIVRTRRGIPLICFECAWSFYSTQDRSAVDSCEHIEVTA